MKPSKLQANLPDPTHYQFEVLQTILALAVELGCPPSVSSLSAALEKDRRAVFQTVKILRGKGLLMEPAYRGAPLVVTNRGKLMIETTLDAGVKE